MSRDNGCASSIVNKLLNLLGRDRVLLPIPRGGKKPVIEGWQNTSIHRMGEPEYLAQLNNKANIGVLLGHGLITIDLDRNEDVKPFLNLNPHLHETLRSRRKRGCNFWLRIKGEYPSSCKLKTQNGADWGEFRADGNQTVIYGAAIDRKKGETKLTEYKIVVRANPIELAFDEINWPTDLVLPWIPLATANSSDKSLEDLKQAYGEPFYTDKDGNPTSLNQAFWAALYAHEHIVLWEPNERSFWTYNADTGIYEETSADAIKRSIAARLLEASRQVNCFWLEKQRTDMRLNAIVAHLRGIVEKRDAFAHREHKIHLANGIFSFENGGQLLEFLPTFISRNRSTIVFDENAVCPRFLNELIYPAMHQDDVVLVQKYFGQCMLGWNLTQKLLILEGLDDLGKSTLVLVIQRVVGLKNCTQLRTKMLEERFEIFRFLKKTLLTGIDVEPNFLNTRAAYVLKGLVGGDIFDAEQKSGTGSFQVQGVFNAIVTSNSRQRVNLSGGDVGAWRRRLLKIRCEGEKPKRKIRRFDELLVRQEGSGILNWAIAGAAMLLDEIAETGDIALTERQRKVVDGLLAESDSLRFFLRNKVQKSESDDLSVDEIIEAYAKFCPEMGWAPLPITVIHKSLDGLMLELFHVLKAHSLKRDGRSMRGFRGVGLKPMEPDE
jgi:phage/plasmid-associated DNA primase